MALAKKANTAASRSLQKVSDWLQSVEPPTSVALECELNSEQLGGDVCVDGNHGDEFAQPVECTANAEQPGGNSCVDGNRADKSAAVEHQAQRQMLNPSTSTFEYESDSGGEQPFSDRNRVDKSAAVEHRAKRQMLNPSTGIFEYESDSGQSFSSRVSGTTNNTYDSECIPVSLRFVVLSSSLLPVRIWDKLFFLYLWNIWGSELIKKFCIACSWLTGFWVLI